MRLTHLHADDFLSFADFQLDALDPKLTTIVGPNGAGKSNLVRAIELVVRILKWTNESPRKELARDYLQAAKFGVTPARFAVKLGIQLDTDFERHMLMTWLRTALLSTYVRGHQERVESADAHLIAAVEEDHVETLASGSIVVIFESLPAPRLSVGYEFEVDGQCFCYLIQASGRQGGIVRGCLADNLRRDGPSRDPFLLLTDEDPSRLTEEPPRLDFTPERLLPAEDELIDLDIQPIYNWQQTETAYQFIDIFRVTGDNRVFMLDLVLTSALSQIVVVGENRGAPRRTYSAEELAPSFSTRPLEDTPVELLLLKLGDADQRQRFRHAQQLFEQLTDATFDLHLQPAANPPADQQGQYFYVDVEITDEPVVAPLRFAGAGRWEALILSTALTAGGAVTILDEPALNLHPTLQRRLLHAIRQGSSQTLLITHSPFLVPAQSGEEIEKIVRLTRDNARTHSHRASFAQYPHLAPEKASKLQRMVGSSDVRALLFSSGALLVEGATEVGALEIWLPRIAGLPSPQDLNILVTSVDGDGFLGHYVSYLDMFAIPWVILCDGKALRLDTEKALHKWLAAAHTRDLPTDTAGFQAIRDAWAKKGVFTLAQAFGDEIEHYMQRTDPAAWETVLKLTPNKVRRGREFAEIVPPPQDVRLFYADVLRHLRVHPQDAKPPQQ